MDCKKTMALVTAVMAVFLPALASATDYMVGDSTGWALGMNYTEWASGKEFKVGDKLIFNYNTPTHNVAKVDGPNFRACTAPAGAEILMSGMDEIVIKSPGRKWYLCTKGNHCELGMKLLINVAAEVGAPAPSTGGQTGASVKTSTFGFGYGAVLAVAAAAAVLV